MHIRCFSFIALASVLTSSLFAEIFTLTDSQGRSIKADVIAVEEDMIKIKREDGVSFDLPMNKLSEADQKDLRVWAKKEAEKPPAAGSLELFASRAKFDSKKTQRLETYASYGSDGKVSYEKRMRITTNEDWGFSLTITNKTLKPIDGLQVEYRLFAETGWSQKREERLAGSIDIGTIKARDQAIFKTDTITLTKINWIGESAKNVGSQIQGIWVRVYRNKVLLLDSSTPESLRTTKKW